LFISIFFLCCCAQILACIFVAVKSFATPAHRDLIDMVMTVKKSSQVTGLENVSKTKIRGVLALLKHGELLITQGDYGVPVRIYLAMGIDSFRDLRERHDTFLNMYMANHHLFIPTLLRNELVWNVDEATQNMRLEAIDKLTTKFKCILGAYPEYSQEHFGVGETSSMTSGLTSGNITPPTPGSGGGGGGGSSVSSGSTPNWHHHHHQQQQQSQSGSDGLYGTSAGSYAAARSNTSLTTGAGSAGNGSYSIVPPLPPSPSQPQQSLKLPAHASLNRYPPPQYPQQQQQQGGGMSMGMGGGNRGVAVPPSGNRYTTGGVAGNPRSSGPGGMGGGVGVGIVGNRAPLASQPMQFGGAVGRPGPAGSGSGSAAPYPYNPQYGAYNRGSSSTTTTGGGNTGGYLNTREFDPQQQQLHEKFSDPYYTQQQGRAGQQQHLPPPPPHRSPVYGPQEQSQQQQGQQQQGRGGQYQLQQPQLGDWQGGGEAYSDVFQQPGSLTFGTSAARDSDLLLQQQSRAGASSRAPGSGTGTGSGTGSGNGSSPLNSAVSAAHNSPAYASSPGSTGTGTGNTSRDRGSSLGFEQLNISLGSNAEYDFGQFPLTSSAASTVSTSLGLSSNSRLSLQSSHGNSSFSSSATATATAATGASPSLSAITGPLGLAIAPPPLQLSGGSSNLPEKSPSHSLLSSSASSSSSAQTSPHPSAGSSLNTHISPTDFMLQQQRQQYLHQQPHPSQMPAHLSTFNVDYWKSSSISSNTSSNNKSDGALNHAASSGLGLWEARDGVTNASSARDRFPSATSVTTHDSSYTNGSLQDGFHAEFEGLHGGASYYAGDRINGDTYSLPTL
jgi:hypothetical protein